MARSNLAHIADQLQWSATSLVIGTLIVCSIVVLVFEHTIVKHGRVRLRYLRGPLALFAAFAVTAVVAPAPGIAQGRDLPVGLPDLISDPPEIWFTKDIIDGNGELIRIMAFDGFLHNIGSGSLELTGNPQIEDGMKQLVFNGDEWEEVGTATVKFETDDGHNHFHLMNAVAYELWDEGRTTTMSDAQKVGFCLIDTEPVEQISDAFYTIDDSNYCGQDSPEDTELTMGISPGWRDVYGAKVTFQWVDVSRTQPGRYWVTAETDPRNQIVEANEDNNGIVFSVNKFAVPGYVARELPMQDAAEPIMLKASVVGTVGSRAFVIVDGPKNGSLDVPVGFDLLGSQVRYTPDPGFDGVDSFSYYAHDVTSAFPLNPQVVTVEVAATVDGADSPDSPPPTDRGISPIDPQVATTHDFVSIQLETSADGANTQWYARDLPPGLMLHSNTGLISGHPTTRGDYETEVVATGPDGDVTTSIEFAITQAEQATLEPLNHFSSRSDIRSLTLGTGVAGAKYETDGLPEGTGVSDDLPVLFGPALEMGSFDVEIREVIDGEVTNTINFTWTIRPSNQPAFAL